MFLYKEYVLNESKSKSLEVGNIVYLSNNYRKYSCSGKFAIIEAIEGKSKDKIYTVRLQSNELVEWMAFDHINFKYVDVIYLSVYQVSKLVVVNADILKLWKKGHLIPFKCSNKFQRILDYMGFEIKIPHVDTSYVDIEENSNTGVTYLPITKYKSEVENRYGVIPYQVKGRQCMKVSKILKKLNPSLSETELEGFVAQYKAVYKIIVEETSQRVIIVTGEKIRYWYLGDRYARDKYGNTGTLGNSCMRYSRSQRRFDIYCENPDKCAMAIYVDENSMLLARALIWKLDDGTIYMDRIYWVNQEDRMQLMQYSKMMNMKSYDNNDYDRYVMIVSLNKDYGDPHMNPYMDTLRYFDFSNKRLMNVRAQNLTDARTLLYNDHD